ncbi:Tetratricopeptide repeat [Arabidopsis thaliana x Arabidopsis arenosa]|uniref:Tetratricopeptide repeat n=1 Tax=Arabidopsis thaliana x Arabidopsis arenosa TaxID=1240361 RepID=A0A8T2AR70_9BRAS|nr:Tetratricopeptide repeat [Arabidopsis thaliana x Arabidopsis arenosa]
MASPANFQLSRPKFNLQINLERKSPLNLSFPLLFRDQAKSTSTRFPTIRASSSSSPSNHKPSLLKTTFISLTAAAALFSASFYFVYKPAATTPVAVVEETVEKHLEILSNDVKALSLLTEIKYKSDRHEEAIEVLDRLIKIEPDERKWPAMKARILSYHGKSELAIEAFEGILEKDPIRVDAYHYLVMEYYDSKPKLTELEKRINKVIRRCKKEKKTKEIRGFRMLIAQIKVIEGDSVEAIRICDELVKDDPEDFTIYLFQGIVYILMNKEEEAAKQFEQVSRVMPMNHPSRETATTSKQWRVIVAYDNVYCYLLTFARLSMPSLFSKFGK